MWYTVKFNQSRNIFIVSNLTISGIVKNDSSRVKFNVMNWTAVHRSFTSSPRAIVVEETLANGKDALAPLPNDGVDRTRIQLPGVTFLPRFGNRPAFSIRRAVSTPESNINRVVSDFVDACLLRNPGKSRHVQGDAGEYHAEWLRVEGGFRDENQNDLNQNDLCDQNLIFAPRLVFAAVSD